MPFSFAVCLASGEFLGFPLPFFRDFPLAVWGKFCIFAAEKGKKGFNYGNAFYNTGYRLRLSLFEKVGSRKIR